MKTIKLIILSSLCCLVLSCGNEEKKPPKKIIESVNQLTPASVKTKISSQNISAPRAIQLKKKIDKKTAFAVKNPIELPPIVQSSKDTKSAETEIDKDAGKQLINFVNIKKILDNCEIGQTVTQKQLTENFDIAKEAVKLVKTVTKTAENELAVKWQSTWFVEKLSDAKLEDGKMKVKFKANKMYLSGKAIGIKYERKIYNDLIIIGRSAYIPSVKGYSWQIGK